MWSLRRQADQNILIAYYVASSELDEDDILSYLGTKLPDYMIPSRLVYLEKLPMNLNGMLDRKALPDPEFVTKDRYIAPRNDLETKVCAIWGDVLGIPEDKVGIQDDFFRLGGNRHFCNKTCEQIKQAILNSNISVPIIFSHTVVENLVKYLQNSVGENLVIEKANKLTKKPRYLLRKKDYGLSSSTNKGPTHIIFL